MVMSENSQVAALAAENAALKAQAATLDFLEIMEPLAGVLSVNRWPLLGICRMQKSVTRHAALTTGTGAG